MNCNEGPEAALVEALLPFLGKGEGEGEADGADGAEGAGDGSAGPWHGSDRLQVAAAGGLVQREGCVAVLARAYTDTVLGDSRTELAGDGERTVDGNATVKVAGGTDALAVEGDAEIRFDDRQVMMSGTVEREWTGAITRMAGMEGVICGGAYTKVCAGAAMTVCAIATGDVYGVCARFAGARVHVAGLHYRTARAAMWRTGAYVRSAGVVVEPLIGSPSQHGPAKSIGQKAARVLRGAGAVLPFVDIAVGIIAIPVGIATLIANIVRRKSPEPPSGPPRLRMRNGVRVNNAGLEVHT